MRLGPLLKTTVGVIWLGLAVVAVGLSAWGIARANYRQTALTEVEENAAALAGQHLLLLESELARFRLMPVVLTQSQDLAAQLIAMPPRSDLRPNDLDRHLAFLAKETGAPILYVIDTKGLVVAASNAGSESSFLGQNFAYRPYFKGALADGFAEYHAAGALSGEPGIFVARRLGPPQAPIGVVVIKYEFERLLQLWAKDPGITLVENARGMVLVASIPSLALHGLRPLSQGAQEEILASGQFRASSFAPGPLRQTDAGYFLHGAGGQTRELIGASLALSGQRQGLRLLHLLDPADALAAAARKAGLVALIAAALTALAGAAFMVIAGRGARKRAKQLAAHRALKAAVAERTRDLRHEMAERARSDAAFRQAREALAHANRLAALGQITAGLVHEINQPVATIRSLSENARQHLAAGRNGRVDQSLEAVVDLTARIGGLTKSMRQSASRGQSALQEIALSDALAGAQLILGDRIQRAGIALVLPQSDPRLWVEPLALEQVLVNLIGNAIEALTLAGAARPKILLELERADGMAKLLVCDNGPGIAPDLRDRVFDPFVTGKPDGLGLGLSIARDLMRRMGGELSLAPSPLGGAGFLLALPMALPKALGGHDETPHI